MDTMFGNVPPINQSPEFLIAFFSVLITTTISIIAIGCISYLVAQRSKMRFAGALMGAGLGLLIGGVMGSIFFGLLGLFFDRMYGKSSH
jgi:hypothetical protein